MEADLQDEFRRAIDTLPGLVWRAGPEGAVDFLNQRWCEYSGVTVQDGCGWGWETIIHPDDRARLVDHWRSLLARGEPGEAEARLRRCDGVFRWFLIRAVPLCDTDGKVVKWYGQHTDIEDRKHAEALLAGEKQLLERIASGAALAVVLDAVCRFVEFTDAGCHCSILLIDDEGATVHHHAAPTLPPAFVQAIDGRDTALPYWGPCAMAVDRKEQVIVSDIATDARWREFEWSGLALAHGLRSCWTRPILSIGGNAFGTFAVYRREPGHPTSLQQELTDRLTHIASIVIESGRTSAALRERERELCLTVDSIPGLVATLTPTGALETVNEQVLAYCGRTVEGLKGWGTSDTVHPDDLPRTIEIISDSMRTGDPYEIVERIRRFDGVYRWFQVRGQPLRGSDGLIVRWYVLLSDIEDLKRAEAALAVLKDQLYKENLVLRDEVDRASMFEEIVGSSPTLQPVLSRVGKVARTDSTVLITGETGTGKELVARAIHRRSARASRTFVSVNCAAVPRELIASELFGHEKGAFTGATQRRLGRFELAHGGTIFLDEVGDLPAETQVALLRVLQERAFERVGGTTAVRVDVRVIAATNRDLQSAIESGTFRSDLFYRLNVFPISVPALRERADDISLLVEYFIDRYARKAGKTLRRVSKRTLDHLRAYPWPGNVRELQNVIERSVIVCETDEFTVDESWVSARSTIEGPLALSGTVAAQEKALIEDALRACGGRVYGPAGAAARLGIPRSTLESKIRVLRINKNRFRP
jgi:formate hydrogenlyase transcriptional activator